VLYRLQGSQHRGGATRYGKCCRGTKTQESPASGTARGRLLFSQLCTTVREAKLLNGKLEQYQALDEAIRTAQFVRNKCLRYWMDHRGAGKKQLYRLCMDRGFASGKSYPSNWYSHS
jgi:hypothetical protein